MALVWLVFLCHLRSAFVSIVSLPLGVLLAVIPVPIDVVMALCLDRFEPEPARTLAQTFAWGATEPLPVTDRLAATLLSLPIQPEVATLAVDRVAAALRRFCTTLR